MLVAVSHRDELFLGVGLHLTFPHQAKFATLEQRRQHTRRVRYPDWSRLALISPEFARAMFNVRFGARMASPVRILTAVPICDGHDSAINTINLEFIRHGIEVVYLGFHRYAGDIVRAAIQEDVAAIGISSYNGGHIDFFAEVVRQLRKQGAGDIAVFGGGGGTITYDDARRMERQGVDKIFFAGTSLEEMADYVRK